MPINADQLIEPVDGNDRDVVKDEYVSEPEDGTALCLSGGGYRAMLFHVGALIRLNEFGILPRLARISSVSGGSITAGVLGLHWRDLGFDSSGRAINLKKLLVDPIHRIASKTIDRSSIIGGVLLPGSVNERIVGHFRETLFGDATLQDLPADDTGPRFIINATSVQSGALVRMSRPYLADYRVGMICQPTIRLAEAVAASSAFPPFLSPSEIDVEPSDFAPDTTCDLQFEPYTDTMVLTDGGVYDNLGLETAWKRYKTILVSDGGGKLSPQSDPAADWAQHSMRVVEIIDNQVRSLRKRQLIRSFVERIREGAYWGIRTRIQNYGLADALPDGPEQVDKLASIPTRLKRLSTRQQRGIMNWGYAVCDAAVRKHVNQLVGNDAPKSNYPFPNEAV